MLFHNYENFSCVSAGKLDEDTFVYEHSFTKTKVALKISNLKEEFISIGINTPISNDRGIAHILEHCIVCGSENYSLSEVQRLFLNKSKDISAHATVYSELTQFSIFTTQEHTKFINGMKMCLDSIFFPHFLLDRNIFLQEGWHIVKKNDVYDYGGIVYNEMSSKLSNVQNQIMHLLKKNVWGEKASFPGGVPEEIVCSSYEEVVRYYQQYYNSSNMFIFLVIPQDNMKECMEVLDYYFTIERTRMGMRNHDNKDTTKDKHVGLNYCVQEAYNTTYFCKSINLDTSDYYSIYRYQIFRQIIKTCIEMYKRMNHTGNVDVEIWADLYDKYPVLTLVTKVKNEEGGNKLLKEVMNFCLSNISFEVIEETSKKIRQDYELIYEKKRWEFVSYSLFLYWIRTGNSDLKGIDFQSIVTEQAEILMLRVRQDKEFFYQQNSDYIFRSVKPLKKIVKYDKQMLRENTEGNEYYRIRDFESAFLMKNEKEYYKAELMRKYEYKSEKEVWIPLDTGSNVIVRFWFDISMQSMDELFCSKIVTDLLNSFFLEKRLQTYVHVSLETFSKEAVSCPKLCIKVTAPNSAIVQVIDIICLSIQKLLEVSWQHIINLMEVYYSVLVKDVNKNPHMYAVYMALRNCTENSYIYENTYGLHYIRKVKQKISSNPMEQESFFAELRNSVVKIFQTKNLLITYACNGRMEQLCESIVDVIKKCCNELGDVDQCIQDLSKVTLCNQLLEGIYFDSNNYNVAMAVNLPRQKVKYDGKAKIIKKYINEEYFPQELRRKNSVYSYLSNVIPTNGNFYMVSYCDPNIFETVRAFLDFDSFFRKYNMSQSINPMILDVIKEENDFIDYSREEEWIIRGFFSGITYESTCLEMDSIKNATCHQIKNYAAEIAIALKEANICVLGGKEKIISKKEKFSSIYPLDVWLS